MTASGWLGAYRRLVFDGGKAWRRPNTYSFASTEAVLPLVGAEFAKAAVAMPIAFDTQRSNQALRNRALRETARRDVDLNDGSSHKGFWAADERGLDPTLFT